MELRVGIFGWGIVAPKSPNICAFQRNLESSDSWLTPFNGFGQDTFLVGMPEFCFDDYRAWIESRFPPRRYSQLVEKMDEPSLYAIGSFIQALDQNRGLEEELRRLGTLAHVYVGTGIGSVKTISNASVALYKAQRVWDCFWAQPEHNSALRNYLIASASISPSPEIPSHPEKAAPYQKADVEEVWWHYWASHSPELKSYLEEFDRIELLYPVGEIENSKLRVIREKERLVGLLQQKWNAPEPPWSVSPNVIWNIHNTPAAQISMLGGITGLTFAPVAACSTFVVALGLAMKAIKNGDAKVVVVGATDPPPHPLIVGAFYRARVAPASSAVSVPMTHLRGTHISGGSAIWILGDYEHMRSRGFTPLGMEPLAVGFSSDAHHIITPSINGPRLAILQALAEAGVSPDMIRTWDSHATATPGDVSEIAVLRSIISDSVIISARKGTFGHGMSAGSGWELTAQYLGYEQGRLYPTPLRAENLNESIGDLHRNFVYDSYCGVTSGIAGKLSMGIGGINACIISRSWAVA